MVTGPADDVLVLCFVFESVGEVEVADSGAGIDRELGRRIFEPFVQGPSRVAGENGSAGLGLAIARAIVTAHGGRIWLAGDGPGTRIRFSLPAA